MVKFSVPDDPKDMPKSRGNLMAPRSTAGAGTKYPAGDGPKGSGGGHQLGPTGTTKGAGGTRIKGFTGSPPSGGPSSLPLARSQSNPMKR